MEKKKISIEVDAGTFEALNTTYSAFLENDENMKLVYPTFEVYVGNLLDELMIQKQATTMNIPDDTTDDEAREIIESQMPTDMDFGYLRSAIMSNDGMDERTRKIVLEIIEKKEIETLNKEKDKEKKPEEISKQD